MMTLCAAALFALTATTDTLANSYAVYDANGQPTTLEAVCDAALEVQVVFLGETHDDPTGHALQHVLLQTIIKANELVDSDGYRRPGFLAMEMFESDVQVALSEYVDGIISERDFLASTRPWGNYASDYRPLVEAAKASGWSVVGSNAPARYVRLATRDGRRALSRVSPSGSAWLPPLDYLEPSDSLAAKFTALMGDMAGHGAGAPSVAGMLSGQNLRDASMAFWTAQAIKDSPGARVVHVNGSFHSAGGLGIPEHLASYAPGVRRLVVTMEPAPDILARPELDGSDFTILTDDSVVPSRNRPAE